MKQDVVGYEFFPTVIKIGVLILFGCLLFFANRRVSSKIHQTWLNYLGETGLRGFAVLAYALLAIVVCFVEPPETPLGDRLFYWLGALTILIASATYLWRRFGLGLISVSSDDPITGYESEEYGDIFADDKNLATSKKNPKHVGKPGTRKRQK